jgi:peptide deformylase
MSDLHIVTYPHPALKKPAVPVTVFDEKVEEIVQKMMALMYQEEGVGLAAPQVGLSLRIFVLDVSEEKNEPRCFVNPRIVDSQGECLSKEGCLSLPELYLEIKRAETVTVEYQDQKGHPQLWTTDGLAARCIQHEYDHLEGILMYEHLSNLKKMMAVKKLRKYSQSL